MCSVSGSMRSGEVPAKAAARAAARRLRRSRKTERKFTTSSGVSRLSIGSRFANVAYGALVQSATEFKDAGTYAFLERTGNAYRELAREAFTARQL